jgi:hypothetical protein
VKINNKLILLVSALLSILFVVFWEDILPEGAAFLLFVFFYLGPISFLGYETCFMSGPGCAATAPEILYFIGPIILFVVSVMVFYRIASYILKITLRLKP